MTSKQKQKALTHVGLIMTAEAIYDYGLDNECNDDDDEDKTVDLLCDLWSLFYAIDSMENVIWTEEAAKDSNYWCELSVLYHLYDDRLSKMSISFDGVDKDDYMMGTVRIAVDDEEILNGIRYVEIQY